MNFQRYVTEAKVFAQSLSASKRALPSFVIVGAQKGGTTFLFHVLSQHPTVIPSLKKEVHYFDVQYGKPHAANWYRGHFPILGPNQKNVITGEASPYYMFHPAVAARLAKTIPNVKVIFTLRNPADRAFSHYQHNFAKGHETLTFREAIDQETQRLAGEEEKLLSQVGYYSKKHRHFSYRARGVYSVQYQRFLDHFPKDQLLIVQSEKLFGQLPETLATVTDFLGLDRWTPTDVRPQNTKRYESKEVDVRDELAEFYKPYNEKFYEMVGIDYGWK